MQHLLTCAIFYYEFLPYLWEKFSWLGYSEVFTSIQSQGTPLRQQVYQSLAFVAAYSMISMATNLPFSLYYTFVIEQRHGFNKQTLGLFFSDMLKTILLGALFGAPLISAFIYLIKNTGANFFLYLWAFMCVY